MTLHPQARLLLELGAKSDRPPLHTPDPPRARAEYEEIVAKLAGGAPQGVDARDVEIPGPEGGIGARVYRPSADANGLLVYFHGGGFVMGSLETHDASLRRLALAARCTVVAVDYRLAPEHPFPAAVEDAWAAYRWVVEHAADVGRKGDVVSVGGDSAGGNLAANVCLRAKREHGPMPAGQLLIYPATNLAELMPSFEELGEGYLLTRELAAWFMGHYFRGGGDRREATASPLFADDVSGLPPALVITAEYDPLRDEGRAYADKLAAVGVDTRHVEFPGMLHDFFVMGGFMDATGEAIDVCGGALAGWFGGVGA